ncbi:hypothetical protein GUJ93_ZPchr0003g16908 [Zizania palustris]|uniref:Uncharacterized protein n=1 Tax=Zizania palustris TaxID=103762 RepID=A0A8J5S225_ZIZPA|nr:hypothetical protein GUJ93_ZPchr0003g16908 [Zizania palustris]
MGALCLLPSAPPSCSCGGAGSPSRAPKPAGPAPFASYSGAAASGRRLQLVGRRRRAGLARGGERQGRKGDGAEFFGDDGVVEDMDGYLNYLSLEYDSVWDTKPSCSNRKFLNLQGASLGTIFLSGTVVIAGSWLPIHSVVITAGVSFVICGMVVHISLFLPQLGVPVWGGGDGDGALEMAVTIIFNALLLVFMVKLFFAMFQMKLVVIVFYLVVLIFAMSFSAGRRESSF